MTYQVLARKWRPQRFSELVGQEHVTKTLKNAINRNRVAHAYLFVGSRGVGKTTAARLLAKSLNCLNSVDGEPCDQCESCKSILNGSSLDVIEIDGASNNGVDNIRDLRETVNYMPSSGRYKIYIIDEVHMLSKSAWNALLKTLEEPPAHVKFIFATTEADKVLPTVVSRCQRFDFKFISPLLIEKKLREIADAEKIFIEDAALSVIARAADGGMRDAQSIFDQMIAFCGGDSATETISEADVIDVFGMTSTADLMNVIQLMYQDNVSGLLVHINFLATQGRDLDRFFMELLNSLRNLLIIQCCKEYDAILEINSIEVAELKKLSQFPTDMTRAFLDILMVAEGRLRGILNKRVFLEVNLIRAMKEAHAVDINEVISAFVELKDGNLPRQQIVTETVQKKNDKLEAVAELVSQSAPINVQDSVVQVNDLPIHEVIQPTVETLPSDNLPSLTQPIENTPVVQEVVPAQAPSDYEERLSADRVISVQEIVHQVEPHAIEPTETFIPPAPVDEVRNLPSTPVSNADLWHQMIEQLSHEHDSFKLITVLQQMKTVSFANGIFEADFSDDFDHTGSQLVTQSKRKIEQLLTQISGQPSVTFSFTEFTEVFSEPVQTEVIQKKTNAAVLNRITKNPYIQYTCQAFSGEVVDARG